MQITSVNGAVNLIQIYEYNSAESICRLQVKMLQRM
jgi:hypothetical protein